MDSQDDPDTGKAVVLPPEDEAALVALRFRFDGWTAPKQRAFLAALGDTGCIRDACRTVGLSKTSAYRLRNRSAEFAAAWDRALEMAATVLEQVAFQRAVLGVEEPVWHYGKFMGMRRRFSDGLLRLLIMRVAAGARAARGEDAERGGRWPAAAGGSRDSRRPPRTNRPMRVMNRKLGNRFRYLQRILLHFIGFSDRSGSDRLPAARGRAQHVVPASYSRWNADRRSPVKEYGVCPRGKSATTFGCT